MRGYIAIDAFGCEVDPLVDLLASPVRFEACSLEPAAPVIPQVPADSGPPDQPELWNTTLG